MEEVTLTYRFMKLPALFFGGFLIAANATAQIQVELKLPRLQYIAYEPVVANLIITNLAGRDVDLRDGNGQAWFGFEVSGSEGQPIAQATGAAMQAPLNLASGKTVSQKINLTPLYAIHDFGTYRVRANVYFADVNKFFYSQTKVFQITDARPIWQKTVGVPAGGDAAGTVRTYSLMTNRFPDHTSLYMRVENKDSGVVYATYSLGRIISFDQPQAEFDGANRLHVLYCASPRTWGYARIGLDGQLVSRASFSETKTRPHLVHTDDGEIKIGGGIMETPVAQATRDTAPKLSARPNVPKDN